MKAMQALEIYVEDIRKIVLQELIDDEKRFARIGTVYFLSEVNKKLQNMLEENKLDYYQILYMLYDLVDDIKVVAYTFEIIHNVIEDESTKSIDRYNKVLRLRLNLDNYLLGRDKYNASKDSNDSIIKKDSTISNYFDSVSIIVEEETKLDDNYLAKFREIKERIVNEVK